MVASAGPPARIVQHSRSRKSQRARRSARRGGGPVTPTPSSTSKQSPPGRLARLSAPVQSPVDSQGTHASPDEVPTALRPLPAEQCASKQTSSPISERRVYLERQGSPASRPSANESTGSCCLRRPCHPFRPCHPCRRSCLLGLFVRVRRVVSSRGSLGVGSGWAWAYQCSCCACSWVRVRVSVRRAE